MNQDVFSGLIKLRDEVGVFCGSSGGKKKLIRILKLIHQIEIELISDDCPSPVETSALSVSGLLNPREATPASFVDHYRKEDERIPLPNPNYELGN